MLQNTLAATAESTPAPAPTLSIRRIFSAQLVGLLAGISGFLFLIVVMTPLANVFANFMRDLLQPLAGGYSSELETIAAAMTLALFLGPALAAGQLWVVKDWVRWQGRWVVFSWIAFFVMVPVMYSITGDILANSSFGLAITPRLDVREWLRMVCMGLVLSLASFGPGGALVGLVQSFCMKSQRLRWVIGSIIAWVLPLFLVLMLSYIF